VNKGSPFIEAFSSEVGSGKSSGVSGRGAVFVMGATVVEAFGVFEAISCGDGFVAWITGIATAGAFVGDIAAGDSSEAGTETGFILG